MDKVQQELSSAIKTNFALLGLNIPDPSISCNCTVTPGGNKPIAPITITTTPATPSVVSQFVAGGSTMTTDSLPLSLVDPGNAPFILPTGMTVEGVVAAQQTDAQKALQVAEAAAAAAAAKLATTATVTVSTVSNSNSGTGLTTTVSATSSADNTTTSTTTADPYVTTTPAPSALIESFVSRPSNHRYPVVGARLHTMKWDRRDTRSSGDGWGLCRQMSGFQFALVVVTVLAAWYVLKLSHERQ